MFSTFVAHSEDSHTCPSFMMESSKILWVFSFLCICLATGADAIKPLGVEPVSKFESKEIYESNLNSTFRLSPALIPSVYQIELRPILEEVPGSNDTLFTAPGKVSIQFLCANATNTIIVHSRRLTIYPETVKVSSVNGGTDVPIAGQEYKVEDDTYVITLVNNLTQSSEYILTISYLINMDGLDGLNGLYRAYYVDAEGKTHNMAATHMEPTRARKTFPSFDEPGLKTYFDISLGRRENYHTLSNTQIKETANITGLPGWVWDHYDRTVPMPTYLVAAVVSDLVSVTAPEGLFNKPVRIWATKRFIEDGAGNYAAEVAARTLSYFESEFNIPYELLKMDSAAIPQFSPGAMENWGLNLYRENLLLIFPGITSEAERHDVANVIGHELAHQWFGNLVTCKWWSDIWLNEGFATYLSYEVEESTSPEFEPSKRFFTEVIQVGLKSDVLPTTHPIHNPSLETVNVSPLFFDRIGYEKAGSVIRMFERVLGRSTFLERLSEYLTGMKFKAAEQTDLFKFLDQEAITALPEGLTATQFFESWTLKSGFPLIRVTKITNIMCIISQEKFLPKGPLSSNSDTEANEGFWHVPLHVIDSTKPNVSTLIWLKDDELSQSVGIFDLRRWITVNSDASGFFRVLYDGPLTAGIEFQLNSDASVFAPVTRAQFIDDYMTFASSGYAEIETALRLTKYLGAETDLVVWQTALDHLRPIYDKLLEPEDVTAFQNYLLPKINSALDLVNFDQPEGERGSNVTLRALLLNWACEFEDARCVEFAVAKFQEWVDQDGILPPSTPGDHQSLVYCTAVAHPRDGASPLDFAYGKYKADVHPVHKPRLLNSLACPKNEAQLGGILSDIADPESSIVEADRVPLLQSIAGNRAGRQLVIDFLKRNFEGKVFVTPQVFATVLTSLSSFVLPDAAIVDIEAFSSNHADELASVSTTLDTAVAQMKEQRDWYASQGARVLEWLKSN